MIWLILILILIAAAIVVTTLILDRVTSMDCDVARLSVLVVSGLTILVLSIYYPTCYYNTDVEYQMLSDTLQNYDESVLQFERQQIIQKCIEFNAFLSSCKYWNDTFFGDIVPDRVAGLPYLDCNRILNSDI
jgi:hypothetical protein